MAACGLRCQPVDYPRSVPAATNLTNLTAIRVDLPEDGPGSLASSGRRVLGFLADSLLSFLVAGAFTAPSLPRNVSLIVFGIEYFAFAALLGQTPGMFLARVRIVRIDRPAALGPVRAVIRTVLLMLLIPALIWDRNGRGLHDKYSQSAVVRI
jgi:uncharacterized RDD family membrane protein YckC